MIGGKTEVRKLRQLSKDRKVENIAAIFPEKKHNSFLLPQSQKESNITD